jgi:hypothetical protein
MRLSAVVLALLLGPGLALGQAPSREQREQLMKQVTERFLENFRQQAGLTPEQNQKFRALSQRSFDQRRERQQKEQELWRALQMQMRPGIAANTDSVTRLLDAILASRAAAVEELRADHKEYAAFLSPVQRAQLFLAFERLQRNVQMLLQQRMRQNPSLPDDPTPQN